MAFRLTPWQGKKSQNLPARREEGRDPFTMLQREMNRLFEDFNRDVGFGLERGEEGGAFVPHVNISENENEVTVTAELPGMDEKNIDVSISKNVLTLRGEKKDEREEKGRDFYRVERSFGQFHREIPLPGEVVSDKADASFKNGVLSIHLPKSKEAQQEAKKIQVGKQ